MQLVCIPPSDFRGMKTATKNLCDHLLLLPTDCEDLSDLRSETLAELPRMKLLRKSFPESLSEMDILLIALVFEDSFKDTPKSGWKLIDTFFKTSTGNKLDLINRLNKLVRERYLDKVDLSLKSTNSLNRSTYTLQESTLAGLMTGKIEEAFFYKKVDDSGRFVELIRMMQNQVNSDNYNWQEMTEIVKTLIEKNSHLNLVKGYFKLYKAGFKKMEKDQAEYEFLFLVLLLEKFLDGDTELDLDENLSQIESPFFMLDCIRKSIDNDSHPLLRKNYLHEVKGPINSRIRTFTFTEEGIENLLGNEAAKLLRSPSSKNMYLPEKIAACDLFFEGPMANQVAEIESILKQDGFENWRKKIHQKTGKEPGLTMLFFGKPGTGKTELALQLAKNSNRPIIKTDMSEMKSMWFGESEKIVKQVFTRYKYLQKHTKKTPILFLNEADALIGKRLHTSNSLDQTTNAIQNILLDELENFSGILIATTNMKENFDSAFERRFLLKLEFQNPGPELRYTLLQNKFPEIPNDALLKLSQQFALSPAQLENIHRKLNMQELLNKKINASLLQQLFEEEQGAQSKLLGFLTR